ncbi:hypothetical protein BOX15_Mlig009592g2 [Macrostomum lignano]|nr:hypothetical protein BOX15_Mlig009592g2 [Macrostomum lignano]
MTREQREYYANQFLTLCPSLTGRITGPVAKQFFEKSRLPPPELSRIWALSDRDMDGQLNLAEFSTAMHLVVLRRNNVPIPDRLPPVAAGYEPLSDQDEASPPPTMPPPPPIHQQQPPPEPSVFGGIPPTGVGVLHPTPRKPTAHQQQHLLQQHADPSAPTVPPRAASYQLASSAAAAAAAADAAAVASGQPPNRERLLAAVKAQKEKNHTLVRLNNELAVELKEVTEQRIALELELERLKPL